MADEGNAATETAGEPGHASIGQSEFQSTRRFPLPRRNAAPAQIPRYARDDIADQRSTISNGTGAAGPYFRVIFTSPLIVRMTILFFPEPLLPRPWTTRRGVPSPYCHSGDAVICSGKSLVIS